MRFGAPWGLAALALAGPLVLWYVLRSRRPRLIVASTFLWRGTDRSVAAAVPWQRFRPDLTFWLVLLAIVVGAIALAQPYVPVVTTLGDHTVLIVDASGSMLADEDGPTRLELARREAERLLADLAPGQEVSVVEAGARARVLLSASSDPSAVGDALRSVRPTHGGADLDDAFALAASLQRPGQSTVLHLVTDGVVPPDVGTVPEGLVVTAVGDDRPNLAVTRLHAVPLGAGSNQVLAQVRNLGAEPVGARLTLTVDGEEVVTQGLDLAPRGTEDVVLTVDGGDGQVLAARVEPTGTSLTSGARSEDALALDDQAFALLTAPRDLQVLLAGPGNVFLEAALASIPGVTVETSTAVPVTDPEVEVAGSAVDLLVVDRVPAPATVTVPTLLIAPTRWPEGVTTTGAVELPAITFQDPDHAVLADVALADVAIAAADPVEAAPLTALASGPDGALLLAGRLGGTPVVAMTFDLLASNLPLQPSWPVLLANATTWLSGPPVTVPAVAGQRVPIPVPAGATAVVATPPSGEAVRLDPADPVLTVDQVGLWRLAVEGDEVDAGTLAPAVAVNPAPDESDLARPAPTLPTPEADGGERTAGAAEGRAQLGRAVLTGVIALAVLEWLWASLGRRWWSSRRGRRRAVPAPGGA